jgi:hypothetical protein
MVWKMKFFRFRGKKVIIPTHEASIRAPKESLYPAELIEPLDIAIYFHECNKLEESAHYLQISAKEMNPIGILLYAITLRHGLGISSLINLQRRTKK